MIKLDTLSSDFRPIVEAVLEKCRLEGYHMIPFYAIRSPWEQAKLWRKSRTLITVLRMINDLQTLDASFIAQCLIEVGPQQAGPKATNSLPGQSWHQWGEAVDCFLTDPQGNAIWDGNHEGYEFYATTAKAMGLEAGYFWKFKDSVHLQLRKEEVLDVYTWPVIDQEMRERFAKQ